MLCGLSNSAMPMKSITQTRWNRGRSTRNNSWHQILPSKISWKEKKKKKGKEFFLSKKFIPEISATWCSIVQRRPGTEGELVSPLGIDLEKKRASSLSYLRFRLALSNDRPHPSPRAKSLVGIANAYSSSGILPLSASPPSSHSSNAPSRMTRHTDPRFLVRFILAPCDGKRFARQGRIREKRKWKKRMEKSLIDRTEQVIEFSIWEFR